MAVARAFHFSPFFGMDGSILMANCGTRAATEQDMEFQFWRQAEPELDRLTLEMCQAERAAGNSIPQWLLNAEYESFQRKRGSVD